VIAELLPFIIVVSRVGQGRKKKFAIHYRGLFLYDFLTPPNLVKYEVEPGFNLFCWKKVCDGPYGIVPYHIPVSACLCEFECIVHQW
jgi:hypothetical protein